VLDKSHDFAVCEAALSRLQGGLGLTSQSAMQVVVVYIYICRSIDLRSFPQSCLPAGLMRVMGMQYTIPALWQLQSGRLHRIQTHKEHLKHGATVCQNIHVYIHETYHNT